MGNSLYEIDEQILACVDMETGEIVDFEKFESLNIARDQKIESLCLWIKNLNAEAAALKQEKDSFAQRKKTAENKIASIKNYLSDYLNGTKFETTKVKVSFRKSESVEIAEGAKVPEAFIAYEPKYDKKGLKQYLKECGTIEGVSIVVNNNIQIK